MTLLVTVFAAIIATVVWYTKKAEGKNLQLGFLSLMFWGAAIMWLVDSVVEYAEMGAEFFTPEPLDMLNDSYLGLSVVALALIIWIVVLLIKDPRGVFKKNK